MQTVTTMDTPVYVHPAEARRKFEEFASGTIDGSNLARGGLLIAQEEYPRLVVEDAIAELEGIASVVEARCSAREPAIFRLGHLQAVLFDEEGFRGNVDDYYDPRNSYLNEVIDRRLGIPITLSIIFMHIARAVGLDAAGVGLPGHYIVKVQFELSEVYVDPFHEGRTMQVREIDELLVDLSNGRVRLRSEHLRAWTPRETLGRVLANLHNVYTARGDRRRATAAAERIALLQQAAEPVFS